MMFTKDVLFMHVPKTGGMALTSYLLDLLPGDKYYTAPEPDPMVERGRADVYHLAGSRHETLEEAEQIFAPFGFHLSNFPLIIVGARNPYALEVSRYAYLQTGHAIDSGAEQDLAMSSDFATFVLKSDAELSSSIDRYYTIGGKLPENLHIVRQEYMDADLAQALSEVGIEVTRRVPVDNESLHDDYRTYYTELSESIVYEKYRWIFDQGWYKRLDLREEPMPSGGGPAPAHKLPIVGCAKQVGPTSGAYSDGWVGAELRFRVNAVGEADYLTLEFFVPEGPAQEVSLAIGRDTFRGYFENGAAYWTVPCLIPAGTPTLVTVTPSHSWVPADRVDGSPDVRMLSFVLSRLTFSRSGRSRDVFGEAGEPDWDEAIDDSMIKS
jgi:hypothetical protein